MATHWRLALAGAIALTLMAVAASVSADPPIGGEGLGPGGEIVGGEQPSSGASESGPPQEPSLTATATPTPPPPPSDPKPSDPPSSQQQPPPSLPQQPQAPALPAPPPAGGPAAPAPDTTMRSDDPPSEEPPAVAGPREDASGSDGQQAPLGAAQAPPAGRLPDGEGPSQPAAAREASEEGSDDSATSAWLWLMALMAAAALGLLAFGVVKAGPGLLYWLQLFWLWVRKETSGDPHGAPPTPFPENNDFALPEGGAPINPARYDREPPEVAGVRADAGDTAVTLQWVGLPPFCDEHQCHPSECWERHAPATDGHGNVPTPPPENNDFAPPDGDAGASPATAALVAPPPDPEAPPPPTLHEPLPSLEDSLPERWRGPPHHPDRESPRPVGSPPPDEPPLPPQPHPGRPLGVGPFESLIQDSARGEPASPPQAGPHETASLGTGPFESLLQTPPKGQPPRPPRGRGGQSLGAGPFESLLPDRAPKPPAAPSRESESPAGAAGGSPVPLPDDDPPDQPIEPAPDGARDLEGEDLERVLQMRADGGGVDGPDSPPPPESSDFGD